MPLERLIEQRQKGERVASRHIRTPARPSQYAGGLAEELGWPTCEPEIERCVRGLLFGDDHFWLPQPHCDFAAASAAEAALDAEAL